MAAFNRNILKIFKKNSVISALVIAIAFASFKSNPVSSKPEAKETFLKSLNAFNDSVSKLKLAVNSGDEKAIHKAFRQSRLAYKRIELFAEYFYKSSAVQFNGSPLQQADELDLD